MKRSKSKTVSTLLAAASLAALASPALAETGAADAAPPAAQPPADGGDIIVTAQKREQRLSDVPVSVIASTGLQLKSAGVTDVAAIGRVAPSFTVAASVYGFQVFSIRGVNFNTQQASAPPAVSVYVDETPLPYSVMTGGLLLDVERVEVLKGPQGTLFGQNSTAGSINVIAAKPTGTAQAGLRAEVNNFGQVTTEGYISGPLSDSLRARLAVQTTQFGAWQKGYYLYDGKNGDQNKTAARLLIDWQASDRLKFTLNLNGNYDKGEVIQPQLGIVAPVVPGVEPLLDTYPIARRNRDVEIDPGFDTHGNKYMLQGSLRADYQITDRMTLTSLTSYTHFNQKHSPINYDAIAIPNSTADVFAKVSSFNQEVRVSGSLLEDNAVHYVLGANYGHDKIHEGQITDFPGYTPLPVGTQYGIDYGLTARAAAVFGNADYKLTERLTASAGMRYTWTKQTINGCLFGNDIWNGIFAGAAQFLRDSHGLGPLPAGAFAPGTCSTINDNVPNVQDPNGTGLIPDYSATRTIGTQKQNNFSWRGSLSYKITPDNMIYATISRGFKAGVFPVQPNILNSQAAPVKQEKLTSYEIGAKLALFDRKLRFNTSAFYYDYRDKQFYTYFPNFAIGGVSSVIINIPKSRVIGVDADFVFTPTRALTVRGAMTHIATKIQKLGQQLFDGEGAPFDPTGKAFNYAPPWSATFDAEYRIPASEKINVVLGLGGQYYAQSYSDLGEQKILANPAYYTLDLRAGLESTKGWRATVWTRNVTNQNYWSSIYHAGDVYSRYAGMPRTFGVTVALTF